MLWALYRRTRFGFEVAVIADSPRAGRYAGMRTRRTILAVMCLSGALAGIGGASQIGDFRHQLDPKRPAGIGATATPASWSRPWPATTRSPPCMVAFLLGGLSNAGYALQGADFPSGLVGVMRGHHPVLRARAASCCVRYRVRLGPARRPRAASETAGAAA